MSQPVRVGEFFDIPVYLDPTVIPGCVRFVDEEGKTVGLITRIDISSAPAPDQGLTVLTPAEQAAYDYQCAYHPQDSGRYPGEPDWSAMTCEEIAEAREELGI